MRVLTDGAALNDRAEHDIAIRYNAGEIRIVIDGDVAAEATLSAPFLRGNYHGLSFGSPFASSYFNGKLTAFDIHKDASDFPAVPKTKIDTGGPVNLAGDDIITLGASDDIFDSGSGNDKVFGGRGNDDLNGMSGNDTLWGGTGNDTLTGESGADFLDGGDGADILSGGLGNDRYEVDSVGDIITGEIAYAAGGGIDLVKASVDWTMVRNVEILKLQGSEDINGTGNHAPEILIGNSGSNVMSGGGGNDMINSMSGNDTIIGGSGQDTIIGGGGRDTFVYVSILDSHAGAETRDLINGFVHGIDLIDLSKIDANPYIDGDQAFIFLGTGAFDGTGHSSAGQLRYQNYGADWNILSADWNGDGIAEMEIFINRTNFMTGTDFIL
jgi:Ca2+-binding RTX toxin-like protein